MSNPYQSGANWEIHRHIRPSFHHGCSSESSHLCLELSALTEILQKKRTFLDLISWDQRQTSQFVVDSLHKSVSSSLLDLDSAWLKHMSSAQKKRKKKRTHNVLHA